mmetsp:Transcript_18044/g.36702  ORF Transcript_18044/g.36702 Transcript_18044/m.36702 type:complete len:236 (-) Transcript_18044:948-1655(-)
MKSTISKHASALPYSKLFFCMDFNFLASSTMFCSFFPSRYRSLHLTAMPASRRLSVFLISWPGYGLTMSMAVPVARDSAVVSPPGLVMMRSAAAMYSCMTLVKPSSLTLCCGGTPIFSRSLRRSFCLPVMTTISSPVTQLRACSYSVKTDGLPSYMAPLAQMSTMGLFFSPTKPRFLMQTFFDGTSEKAGTQGMPVTRMSSSLIMGLTWVRFPTAPSCPTKNFSFGKLAQYAWAS